MSENVIVSYGYRKVIQLGKGKTVNLPSAWLKRVGVKKGDEIEVFLTDSNSLLIKPILEVRIDERKAVAAMG